MKKPIYYNCFLIGLLIVLPLFTTVKAQGTVKEHSSSSIPKVGEPMPDFKLDHITHYPLKEASLLHFRGKWLIIYNWALYCSSTGYFSKVNELQEKFKDRVQFMLLGSYGHRIVAGSLEDTQAEYEKIREIEGLTIPSAYDKGFKLKESWQISQVPSFIFIDDTGIVRAITNGQNLTHNNLKALLDGNFELPFGIPTPDSLPSFDYKKLLLVDNNGGRDDLFLYRSLLAKNTSWKGTGAGQEINTKLIENKFTFQVLRQPLYRLYNYAYVGQYGWDNTDDSLYGMFAPYPILEIRDSSNFEYDYENNQSLFDYTLSVPEFHAPNKQFLMKTLQQDLLRSFNYKVEIVFRKMPVWKLVVVSETLAKKLKTRGNKTLSPMRSKVGFTAKNIPIDEFLTILNYYHMKDYVPFKNETGIDYNIDLYLDALMTNMDSVKKELKTYGLDLIKEDIKMKVMVISDL